MSRQECAAAIEWGVAQRPFPGQNVSGDLYVVQPWGDCVLLAVMDGLGHGREAAQASQLAAAILRQWSGRGLVAMVNECHEALRGSRGVVLTAGIYHAAVGSLEWLGIGNVEGVLWQRPGCGDAQRQSVLLRGGVVGYQLPRLQVSSLTVTAGDLCCLATDGIAAAFVEATPAFLEPQRLADYTLARYGRMTDDALVLALRFDGRRQP